MDSRVLLGQIFHNAIDSLVVESLKNHAQRFSYLINGQRRERLHVFLPRIGDDRKQQGGNDGQFLFDGLLRLTRILTDEVRQNLFHLVFIKPLLLGHHFLSSFVCQCLQAIAVVL